MSESPKPWSLPLYSGPVYAAPSRLETNPYISLLYSNLRSLGIEVQEFSIVKIFKRRPDVLHFHWPETMFAQVHGLRKVWYYLKFFVGISYARLGGARVIWTVHNIEPHADQTAASRWLYNHVFLRLITHCICLSHLSWQAAQSKLPRLAAKKVSIIPHGHYKPVYPNPASRSEARRGLGVAEDSVVLGCLGMVKRYKNIPRLIREFSVLPGENLRLYVAGSCGDEALRQEIISLASADPRVMLRLEYIPDSEVERIVPAFDMYVLPHNKILNSGMALLALSFDVPLLAPRMGSLVELADQVGEDWVVLYDDKVSSQALVKAIARVGSTLGKACPLGPFDWARVSQTTAEFMGLKR